MIKGMTNAIECFHSCKVYSGKEIAREMKIKMKNDIDVLVKNGHRRPKLTSILIGDKPESIKVIFLIIANSISN